MSLNKDKSIQGLWNEYHCGLNLNLRRNLTDDEIEEWIPLMRHFNID